MHRVALALLCPATGPESPSGCSRPLGVKGEREFKGRGISCCATCDAKYYEGKHVLVVGGGNSAVEESLFIAKFAARITVVHQLAALTANKEAQEKLLAEPKVEVLYQAEPRAFVSHNGRTVDAVLVEDLRTHQQREIPVDGAFVFAGMQPNLDGLGSALELDTWGYVKTDGDMHTSVPGVFAAGDVVSKRYRQMTTAVNDGTIASMALARELTA